MAQSLPIVHAKHYPGIFKSTDPLYMKTMKTVLILCTGNSCRSQIGEAIINHDLAGQVHAVSAGIRPQAQVADGAIAALNQAGIPSEGLTPKTVEVFLDQTIDLVVTVCDNAREARDPAARRADLGT
ncbi:hypothetical protein CCP4SC76_2270007 [Gammaproteobacteria bacterium]